MARVVVMSLDVVGTSMAGPGIRAWEFAHALAVKHEVTLSVPGDCDRTSSTVHIVTRSGEGLDVVADADVVVCQQLPPGLARWAHRHGTRMVLDAYDPEILELLEVFAGESPVFQRRRNTGARRTTDFSLRVADAVICASEKQRDLWLGSLLLADRVTPELYRSDPSLRSLIDVVPFGLQDDDPVHAAPGFRERLGISPDDVVLLWGGGIWNWFDPLTLIRAVELVARQRDDVRLVFLGLKHPNPLVPEMAMAARAVALADELGLTDRVVFFNHGWVPYDERQNHLLEADIGVTTHFEHLETRFSFRTRVLDYLWAGLPIISTAGDSMSDLVRSAGLGRTVPPEDAGALAAAILELADERSVERDAVRAVRESFRWRTVTEPLLTLVDEVLARPAPAWSPGRRVASTQIRLAGIRERLDEDGLAAAVGRVTARVRAPGR